MLDAKESGIMLEKSRINSVFTDHSGTLNFHRVFSVNYVVMDTSDIVQFVYGI